MKKILCFTVVSAMALMSNIMPASADVFVWRDPVSKMTLSFPDTWRQVNNQNPGDVLTLQAAGQNDFAGCKMNVADEGRFKIYPVRYSPQIQRVYISEDFWTQYLGQYNNVVVHNGTDNNGLAEGFASMASVSYETAKGARMKKTAIGFASHYRNRIYTVECSAEQSAYPKWHNAFLSLIKSVDFHDGTNFAFTGYYRDFLKDNTLKVRGPSVFEDTYH